MDFNNKLYELRKKKGLSQEELASRLNVSRQTISKWEVGDSTPDMEKIIAISDLFDISLDELVLDKAPAAPGAPVPQKADLYTDIKENVFTEDNRKKAKKGLKIAAIIVGAVLLIDALTLLVYVIINGGFPK